MTGRRDRHLSALLIGLHVALLVAAPFLAERTSSLYGFVAIILAAGATLAALSRFSSPSWRTILIVAAVLRAAAFWLPPTLSDDAYRYAWDGTVQLEGYSPYLLRPDDDRLSQLRDAETYALLNSREFYSVYPPLSQVVFLASAWIASSHWPTTYYIIKLITILVECLALYGISRLAEPSVGLLYAWNPVVIIEIAGQGHSEGLAVGLLIVGVLLAKKGHGGGAGGLVSASAMVKLFPLVFLPPLWRRLGWGSLATSFVVAAFLAIPYASASALHHVGQSLGLYVRYFEFNAGPYYVVKEILYTFTGHDWSKMIGPAFGGAFLLAVPVIWVADWKFDWSLERVLVCLTSTFFLLSTTIHPWYLVPLMALLVLEKRVRWHWYWLMIVSSGTYLLYVGGPYWTFVIAGWLGWFVLAGIFHSDGVLQTVQRARARRKWRSIRQWIVGNAGEVRLLDLGAAEGYVGLAASREDGIRVHLADVVDLNRTDLAWTHVGAKRLPFESNEFDFCVLYFVLHHTSDPESVVAEASRVAREGVVVVESVYRGRLHKSILCVLDRLANRLRSKGRMTAQEQHLNFKRQDEWVSLFSRAGLTVRESRNTGGWIHPTARFLLTR